jgi:[pyruvate, water dikinase]-phosphate phosphotransferase / [pyruvate, water dikinase] kinase
MPERALEPNQRAVFIVSDGTGITASALAHSLMSQFESLPTVEIRVPFINDVAKAVQCAQRIRDARIRSGVRPIVFSTLVDENVSSALKGRGDTLVDAFYVDLFQSFIAPLEQEFSMASTHAVGRSHGAMDRKEYRDRMEAINFTLAHDDGVTDKDLAEADVILVGVSRSGKTPTSLYLAMQFGIKAANYPLIPDDFERDALPGTLAQHRGKLFGLTIEPSRLAEIRHERRPNSRYASLDNCRYEVDAAEAMMRRENIRWLSSTSKSIEEIAATIMQELRMDNKAF